MTDRETMERIFGKNRPRYRSNEEMVGSWALRFSLCLLGVLAAAALAGYIATR